MIAQLGERQTEDLKVPGSIPGRGIFSQKFCFIILELIQHYNSELIKGQLISKADFQALDSPKKRMDEFPFFDLKSCYVLSKVKRRSFVFLENLRLGNLLLKFTDL